MSTRVLASASALAALALTACIIGGTGTDTENGAKPADSTANGITARVTDGQGAALAGVALRLFDPGYRPDLGLEPADLVNNAPGTLVSDAQGKVRLSLKAAGKFVVEGSAGGKILFFDTLAVADPAQEASFTFRARATSAFQGKVRLASGMRIDSGWVFIQGTGRVSKVDPQGAYDLGTLPADVARMGLGVRFRSSPVAVLRAVSASSMNDSAGYACKEVPADSAARVALPAATVGADSQARLDSSQVAPALKACGTLERGTVINVASGSPVSNAPASPGVNLLVLQGAGTTGYTSPKTMDAVVVPLSQCVPGLGSETTTYSVDLRAAASGNDLVVGDVAQKCIAP